MLLALGAALIYAGQVQLFVPGSVYTYTSLGVVRDGESKEIFEQKYNIYRQPVDRAPDIQARMDEVYVTTRSYRGDVFSLPVDGGSRTFFMTDGREGLEPWQNKAVAALGVLLLMLGVTGIVLEKKLSRYQ